MFRSNRRGSERNVRSPLVDGACLHAGRYLLRWAACCCLLTLAAGCGTTRWSDTPRTATEQMLLSDAIDRAINQLDFSALAGKDVFFDDQYLQGVVDENYIISSLRQHLLASGAILKEKRTDATYVVEARAGAVGTDRHDLLFGVPSVTVPSFVAIPGAPSSIPEIPLIKETEQRAAAKVAVFAYNRVTGRPVWQSGIEPVQSRAEDTWLFGAGPFQKGTIYDGTQFAGGDIELPLVGSNQADDSGHPPISVTAEMTFPELLENRDTEAIANVPGATRHASHVEAATDPVAGNAPGDGRNNANRDAPAAPRHLPAAADQADPLRPEESNADSEVRRAAAASGEPSASRVTGDELPSGSAEPAADLAYRRQMRQSTPLPDEAAPRDAGSSPGARPRRWWDYLNPRFLWKREPGGEPSP